MIKKLFKNEEGFSTLEILIAMVIIVMVLVAVILLIGTNQTTTADVDINQAALTEAKKQLEEAKASASMDFNSIIDGLSYNTSIFTATLDETPINNCRKELTSTVTWPTDPLRPGQVELSTTVINTAEAQALAGNCGPNPPSTDWENLVCNDDGASWDFPQDAGIPAKSINVIKRGPKNYAIITSVGSAAGKRDFWVVDVTNRTSMKEPNPPYKDIEVAAIDMGPGLNDAAIAGNYVFAVNNTPTKQLQVFDISTITSPIYLKTASRSLNPVGGIDPEGQKIFYHNNKVYIGTNYMGLGPGDEFQIFDVTTPTNPSLNPIGRYNVNHNIYKIQVKNEIVAGAPKTLAYLAVSDFAANKPKLLVLDVTTPGLITEIGSFSPVPNDSLYGTALYVLGHTAYLGRQKASSPAKDVYFVDFTTIGSPSTLYSTTLGLTNNNEVRNIIVSGNFMFIAISKSNASDKDTFQVWDISDLSDIKMQKCNYPQDALNFDFDGDFVYVVNRSNQALRIIYDNDNPFP